MIVVIIVAIIFVFVVFNIISRYANPPAAKKHFDIEDVADMAEGATQKVRDHLSKSILKNYLDDEQTVLEIMHDNFLRLKERYKYDSTKLDLIYSDYRQYVDALE